MKEDIKIVEEIKNNYLKASECGLGYPSDSREYKEKAKAIENILNELERLQLINQSLENTKDTCPEMATSGIRCPLKNALNFEKTVHTCLHCGNDTPLYCEKCQQELITKNAELQLQNEKYRKYHLRSLKRWENKFDKQEENFNELLDDYIPKQVIKDKIEEVNEEYKKYTEKWEKSGMNKEHPFYKYIVRLEAQIEILEELLGE